MATVHESLRQYGEQLGRKVKALLNNDLKAILKEEGLQVSGVKATLQERIITHVNEIVNSEDATRFRQIYDLIDSFSNNRRLGPLNIPSSYGAPPTTMNHVQHSQTNGTYSSHAGYGGSQPYSSNYSNSLTFKKSPFYEIRDSLCVPTALPTMNSSRTTSVAVVSFNHEQLAKLSSDPALRVMVYCAADNDQPPKDIAFPTQCELKCNAEQYSGNLKGIKKKPGTTKPADITSFVRRLVGFKNNVSVTYAATDRRYQFCVYLVRKASVEQLVEKVKSGHVITKQTVVNEMIKQARDEDVVATSTNMSLKCPLSAQRMKLPCRSTVCNHNQCFDATSFLQLQEQAPQWACPICNRIFGFDSLVVDQFVEDILKTTPQSTEQVTVEPNGTWKQQGPQNNNGFLTPTARPSTTPAKRKLPDVFDVDGGVEVVDHRLNGVKGGDVRTDSSPQTLSNTAWSSREPSTAASTVSRSGSKRPAEEVIDLTLSDDDEDDEPPRRPVKRQSTGSYITTTTQQTPSVTNISPTAPQSAPAGQTMRPANTQPIQFPRSNLSHSISAPQSHPHHQMQLSPTSPYHTGPNYRRLYGQPGDVWSPSYTSGNS